MKLESVERGGEFVRLGLLYVWETHAHMPSGWTLPDMILEILILCLHTYEGRGQKSCRLEV